MKIKRLFLIFIIIAIIIGLEQGISRCSNKANDVSNSQSGEETSEMDVKIEKIDRPIRDEEGNIIGISYYELPLLPQQTGGQIQINDYLKREMRAFFGNCESDYWDIEGKYQEFEEIVELQKEKIQADQETEKVVPQYSMDSEVVYMDKSIISIKFTKKLCTQGRTYVRYYGMTFFLKSGRRVPLWCFVDMTYDEISALYEMDGYCVLRGTKAQPVFQGKRYPLCYQYFYNGENLILIKDYQGRDVLSEQSELVVWDGVIPEVSEEEELEELEEEPKSVLERCDRTKIPDRTSKVMHKYTENPRFDKYERVIGIAYYDQPVLLGENDAIYKINAYYENEVKAFQGEKAFAETWENAFTDLYIKYAYDALAKEPLRYTVDTRVMYMDEDIVSIMQVERRKLESEEYLCYGNVFDLHTGEQVPITSLTDITWEDMLEMAGLDGTDMEENIDMQYQYFYDGNNFYINFGYLVSDKEAQELCCWNGKLGRDCETMQVDGREVLTMEFDDFESEELGEFIPDEDIPEIISWMFNYLYPDARQMEGHLEKIMKPDQICYKWKVENEDGTLGDPCYLYLDWYSDDGLCCKFSQYDELWYHNGQNSEHYRNVYSGDWLLNTRTKEVIPKQVIYEDADLIIPNEEYEDIINDYQFDKNFGDLCSQTESSEEIEIGKYKSNHYLEVTVKRNDQSIKYKNGNNMATIYYEKPIVSGDSEAAKKINAYFDQEEKCWLEGEAGRISFYEEDYLDEFMEGYDRMMERYGEETLSDAPCIHTIDTRIKYLDDHILSIMQIATGRFESGYTLYYGSTFDLNTGELLSITDLMDISAEDMRNIIEDATYEGYYSDLSDDYIMEYDEQQVDMRYEYFLGGTYLYLIDNSREYHSNRDADLIRYRKGEKPEAIYYFSVDSDNDVKHKLQTTIDNRW